MCTRFKGGLNEEIHMLVGALELKKIVMLSKRAQKMEGIWKEKKNDDLELWDSGKQIMTKTFSSPPSKKMKDTRSRFHEEIDWSKVIWDLRKLL